MLVLSRKCKESIVIGDQIVIEILEISNNKIRVGIAAPDHVRVVRGELTPKESVHGRGAANGQDAMGKPSPDSANSQVPASPKSSEQRRASLTSGPLGKSRQRAGGGSDNPNLRTVSDLARHRLRQLRQQVVPDLADVELTGQEVAETASDYQVPTKREQQVFEPRLRAAEDRLTTGEVYWQVAALNHYRNEWVAEESTWFRTSELESTLATADAGQ